jgi:hypothetical protein
MEMSPFAVKGCKMCALWVFEQEAFFIVSHLLEHGVSVFPVSSEGLLRSVASYDIQVDVENLVF